MQRTEMDVALEANTPTVVVPRFGKFVPLEENGHRFLVCADGLWVECRRPWIHAILPLAKQSTTAMPYGKVEMQVNLAFEALPAHTILKFTEEARSHHPMEVGALVSWSQVTGEFTYHPCEVLAQGVGHLKQRWPSLAPGAWPVLDLHSHGPIRAFFSQEDRRDTGMEVIVAGVVGRLDQQVPELLLSLFACGIEVQVSMPMELDGQFKFVKSIKVLQS